MIIPTESPELGLFCLNICTVKSAVWLISLDMTSVKYIYIYVYWQFLYKPSPKITTAVYSLFVMTNNQDSGTKTKTVESLFCCRHCRIPKLIYLLGLLWKPSITQRLLWRCNVLLQSFSAPTTCVLLKKGISKHTVDPDATKLKLGGNHCWDPGLVHFPMNTFVAICIGLFWVCEKMTEIFF